MGFPKSVKDAAFKRPGGRCECKRTAHRSHPEGRCKTAISVLSVDYHDVRSRKADGPDTLANCEAMCRKCHRLTKSFGAEAARGSLRRRRPPSPASPPSSQLGAALPLPTPTGRGSGHLTPSERVHAQGGTQPWQRPLLR